MTENKNLLPARSPGWQEFLNTHPEWRTAPRGVFTAHPLTPWVDIASTQDLSTHLGQPLSTALIELRMREDGMTRPDIGQVIENNTFPGVLRWWTIPVQDRANGRRFLADFLIIPAPAETFYRPDTKDLAYGWVEAAVRMFYDEAKADGVECFTVGVGAATKNATDHGARLLAENPDWANDPNFSVTHGNAGTSWFVLDQLRMAGYQQGDDITLLGANGSMGEVLAKLIASTLRPRTLTLVGRPDRSGSRKNLARLQELRDEVYRYMADDGGSDGVTVAIHQDAKTACHAVDSQFVIFCTHAHAADPSDIPEGAIVIDATTPAACSKGPDWSQHLVITAGCGKITKGFSTGKPSADLFPFGFGFLGQEPVLDIGCGSAQGWGCFLEFLFLGLEGWEGKVVGSDVSLEHVLYCRDLFGRYGVTAQDPDSFGRPLTHQQVADFADQKRGRLQELRNPTPPEGIPAV